MEENENSNDYKNIYLGAIILLVLGLGTMTFFWSTMRNEAKECAHINLKYQDTLQGMNKMHVFKCDLGLIQMTIPTKKFN